MAAHTRQRNRAVADTAPAGPWVLAALISVIVPAFNRAAVIGAAVLLKQALPSADAELEVIVADDASDDDLAGALVCGPGKYAAKPRATRLDARPNNAG